MGKPTFDSWNSKISDLGVWTVMFENQTARFWISSYQVKV